MSEVMLEIDNVSKIYPGRQRLFGRSQPITALNGVSLSVNQGKSYGLVGESGSGKTTLTRSILHLETPTKGAIRFQGKDLKQLSAPELRRMRARIQIVFQDPYASLNPRMSVQDIVTEPMVVHHETMGLSRRQRTDRAAELLSLVGLGQQHLHRYPHEFSGGQRQRICIARALASGPDLILVLPVCWRQLAKEKRRDPAFANTSQSTANKLAIPFGQHGQDRIGGVISPATSCLRTVQLKLRLCDPVRTDLHPLEGTLV